MGNGILSRANSGDGAKIGTIRLSARDSLGEKWALCNGDPVTGGGISNNPLNASNWGICTLNSWFGYRNIAYDYINNKYYYADGYRGYYEINNGSIGSCISSGRLSTSGNNYELRTMFCKLGYLVSVYNYNGYGYAIIHNLNTGVTKTFNQF